MEDKILTKEDKKLLEDILVARKKEELGISKLYEFASEYLKEKYYKKILEIFKSNIEILDKYKKVRNKFRDDSRFYGASIGLSDLDNSNLLYNYPKMLKDGIGIDTKFLYQELDPLDYITSNSEENLCPISKSYDKYIDIEYPQELPGLKILLSISEKIGIKDELEKIHESLITILNEDERRDLLNLESEIIHKKFILDNYLRVFKYPKSTSSVYGFKEFLWNIKTWDQLKELNESWYDLLLNNKDSNVSDLDLSEKTIEEILEDLDKTLGL